MSVLENSNLSGCGSYCLFVVVVIVVYFFVAGVLVEVCFRFILNKSNHFQSLTVKISENLFLRENYWLEIGFFFNTSLKDKEALLECIYFHFLTDSFLSGRIHSLHWIP